MSAGAGARDAGQPEPLGAPDGGDVGRQADPPAAPGLPAGVQADCEGQYGVRATWPRRVGPADTQEVRTAPYFIRLRTLLDHKRKGYMSSS
jgi:hypothetical protein